MAKILLIEDNIEIHEIIKTVLETEHEVISAYSGTEGVYYFEASQPQLVLLDIMLPGQTGDQVLHAIRSKSQVPIIMITALGDKQLVHDYLLAGANDYIVKPFDLDELYARVTVQLRQPLLAGQETACIQFKQLQLNRDSFEVTNGTRHVRLAKKEFQILMLLVAHPKKIYTKEELFELVWQEPYLVGDNTINTHLSNLRKKIAMVDETQEYIETIWGLGVRLKGES